MQKHKEQTAQDKKLLDLAPNFLKSISYVDAKVLSNLHKFFKEEYIFLSINKEFEDYKYRTEWVDNITHLESLATAFKGYKRNEIEMALAIGFKVLDENRTKMLTKKESEVTNA